MNNIDLNVEVRSEMKKGPNKRLKAGGMIPAVLYGKHISPMSLKVESKKVNALRTNKNIKSTLITLKSEEERVNDKIVMLKNLQVEPVTQKVEHIDFYAIDLNEPVIVQIPIIITGKAAGIAFGGIVSVFKRLLTIKCLPTKIPNDVKVDITNLQLNQSIHIESLPFDESYKIMDNPKDTIVNVAVLAEEKAKTEGEEEAVAETAATPAAEEKK